MRCSTTVNTSRIIIEIVIVIGCKHSEGVLLFCCTNVILANILEVSCNIITFNAIITLKFSTVVIVLVVDFTVNLVSHLSFDLTINVLWFMTTPHHHFLIRVVRRLKVGFLSKSKDTRISCGSIAKTKFSKCLGGLERRIITSNSSAILILISAFQIIP